MKNFDMYDVVALKADLPEKNLQEGQVGTIVMIYDYGQAYEVDFVDSEGHTYALLTLKPEQLMQLHYQPAEKTAA